MHVAQAASMTAASTGVQGRQRPSAILNDQALRGLDSTRHPAVRRGRRLQELAVRRIAEVKIRAPGSCRQKRTSHWTHRYVTVCRTRVPWSFSSSFSDSTLEKTLPSPAIFPEKNDGDWPSAVARCGPAPDG